MSVVATNPSIQESIGSGRVGSVRFAPEIMSGSIPQNTK